MLIACGQTQALIQIGLTHYKFIFQRTAEIHGKSASNIVIIPRAALRANNQVLIVDANNQLRHRDVQILRQVNEDIYISAGLIDGERLCISTLDNALEGMTVRTIDTNNPANPS